MTHHRSSGWFVVLAVIVGLSAIEGSLVHFGLGELGWPGVAWAVTAAHVYGVGWLLADAWAMHAHPSRIDGTHIDLRVGRRWRAEVPRVDLQVERISGAEPEDLDLSVLGGANLRLRPARPVTVSGPFGLARTSDRLAIQVDDVDRVFRQLTER